MKRRLRIAGLFLLVFVLACYLALHLAARSEWFKSRVQSEVSKRTGYEIRIEALGLTPWLGFAASGISVSKSGKELFQGKSIAIFSWPLDLARGKISRLSLEKPVLRLSMQDLFNSSAKTSPNVSIGSLNVDDGEIVLETEQSGPFAVRAVFLSANNVNVGGETGLQLRARLPALNGSATLSFSGGAEGKQAEIQVDQEAEKSLTRLLSKADEKRVFAARFQMKTDKANAYEVKGSGRIDGFRLGPESIDGQFSTLVGTDAKLGQLALSLELNLPRFPAKLLPMEIPLNLGPVSATLQGVYSVAQKTLKLQKLYAASNIGTLAGEGTAALGEKPQSLNAALRLRDVALESLKAWMPGPLRALTYSGKIAADINLSGPYSDPVARGVAWSDANKIEGERISLDQLSMKLPFQWSRSSLRVQAGRLQANNLALGRKGAAQFQVREASLAGDILKEPQKPLEVTTDFQILEGRFSSADESKVGEHLTVKGRFVCLNCAGDLSFKGEAKVESLELLWSKFFGDFKEEKPSLEIDGRYNKKDDELALNRFLVALNSAGQLELAGNVRHALDNPTFDLDVRSNDLRHTGLYDFFIRDTFKASYPGLAQIAVGGKSSVAFRARGSAGDFTIDGILRAQQGEIREKAGRWRIGPVALELPLRIHYPQAEKVLPGDSLSNGKITVDSISTESMTIPKISVPVALSNNALRFPEPIRLALFGGSAVINGLAWSDVIGAPTDVSFSLGINDLKLLDLTQAMGWHRFGGSLSGSIPDVRWTGDSLHSSGAITLNMFGGRVTVRGMEVERPFSSVRSIKMDAKIEDLNLEQASETFDFGKISGVLAGTIDGLVISQGQPAEFKADLQTVEKSGVSQWISVEALNKITILSSGNEAGFIYGTLAEFFDFYRYSEMGFKATLKNDTLILRGVESKEGKDYLVVGTLLPPTVNIVSYTQEVSFSELMRRLERVRDAGKPHQSGK